MTIIQKYDAELQCEMQRNMICKSQFVLCVCRVAFCIFGLHVTFAPLTFPLCLSICLWLLLGLLPAAVLLVQ